MTESAAGPALTAAERQAAEALLTEAWGERAEVRVAEPIWDRSHVVRLHLGAGRSAVLKRRGEREHDRRDLGFDGACRSGPPAPGLPLASANGMHHGPFGKKNFNYPERAVVLRSRPGRGADRARTASAGPSAARRSVVAPTRL